MVHWKRRADGKQGEKQWWWIHRYTLVVMGTVHGDDDGGGVHGGALGARKGEMGSGGRYKEQK
ncbi:hypothetical protein Scep_017681 [Stephania cephalantha]|uniref:Uncharacterized protein n=1 Tax=Stephania cephalantha TaxID=152367 RepID=A0AAP0NUG3_9MAGN